MAEQETVGTELAKKQSQEIISNAIKHNNGGYFEYKVVPVKDLMDGRANADKIEEILNLYGEMGWMLKDTIVNEIGTSFNSNEEEGVPVTTQEQTLLIFERWRQY